MIFGLIISLSLDEIVAYEGSIEETLELAKSKVYKEYPESDPTTYYHTDAPLRYLAHNGMFFLFVISGLGIAITFGFFILRKIKLKKN